MPPKIDLTAAKKMLHLQTLCSIKAKGFIPAEISKTTLLSADACRSAASFFNAVNLSSTSKSVNFIETEKTIMLALKYDGDVDKVPFAQKKQESRQAMTFNPPTITEKDIGDALHSLTYDHNVGAYTIASERHGVPISNFGQKAILEERLKNSLVFILKYPEGSDYCLGGLCTGKPQTTILNEIFTPEKLDSEQIHSIVCHEELSFLTRLCFPKANIISVQPKQISLNVEPSLISMPIKFTKVTAPDYEAGFKKFVSDPKNPKQFLVHTVRLYTNGDIATLKALPSMHKEIYYLPEQAKTSMAEFAEYFGCTTGKVTNGTFTLTAASILLLKPVREYFHIERKSITALTDTHYGYIKALFPHATLEKKTETNDYLVTAPAMVFKKIDALITKGINNTAATVIQSLGRGFIIRANLKKEDIYLDLDAKNTAATTIQSYFKGWSTRKRINEIKAIEREVAALQTTLTTKKAALSSRYKLL